MKLPVHGHLAKVAKKVSHHPSLFAFIAFWAVLFHLNFHSSAKLPETLRIIAQDFDQYYQGGVVAATGKWNELYPKSIPENLSPTQAILCPSISNELLRRGSPIRTKWIFPPPLAVFFTPLSVFNYGTALRLWILFLILSSAELLLITERLFVRFGFSNVTTQTLVLAMGFSIGMRNAIAGGNITPVVGIGTALAMSGLLSEKPCKAVAGFFLSGATKGTSAFWVPLLIVRREWRTICAGISAVIVFFAIGFAAGVRMESYSEFISKVIPAGRGTLYTTNWNVGFPSMVVNFIGADKINSRELVTTFSIVSGIILICCYAMSSRYDVRQDRRLVPLCLVVSLVLFNFFSNISWPYYSTQFFPLVPVCLALCGHRFRCLLVLVLFPYLFDPGILRAVSKIDGLSNVKHLATIGSAIWLVWAMLELSRLSKLRSGRIWPQ